MGFTHPFVPKANAITHSHPKIIRHVGNAYVLRVCIVVWNLWRNGTSRKCAFGTANAAKSIPNHRKMLWWSVSTRCSSGGVGSGDALKNERFSSCESCSIISFIHGISIAKKHFDERKKNSLLAKNISRFIHEFMSHYSCFRLRCCHLFSILAKLSAKLSLAKRTLNHFYSCVLTAKTHIIPFISFNNTKLVFEWGKIRIIVAPSGSSRQGGCTRRNPWKNVIHPMKMI